MITATAEAHRADDDLERVTLAGLGASQASLARVRAGVVRSWRTGHRFSAQAELLNNLAPVMARTMAMAHLLGERRVVLSAPRVLALDWDESEHPREPSGTSRGGEFTTDFSRFDSVDSVGDLRRVNEIGSAYDVEDFYDKVILPLHNKNTVKPLDEFAKRRRREFAKLRIASLRNMWKDCASTSSFGGFLSNGEVTAYRGVEPGGKDLGRHWTLSKKIAESFSRHGSATGLRREGVAGGAVRSVTIPVSRVMYYSDAQGEREIVLGVELSFGRDLALDRFSEVTRQLKVAGLDRGLNRLQRGYARRVYESLRQLGAEVDATTRAVVGSLVAEGEPPGRALQVLRATLDRLGVGPEAQSRAETLYRTEAAIAYQTGRWAKVQERWDDVWGFAYVTMRDDRVRPSHAALEGTRLEKDHPFWQRWWPPNGWNCRCQVAVIWRTPGYRHRPVKPGKLNGVVPRPDRGFERNFGAQGVLSLAWDESEHPREPVGLPEGGQFTSLMPTSTSGLKYVKPLGGSTGASLYEDENGNRYVLKKGASQAHMENEVAANALYRKLGVPVPKSRVVAHEGGKAMLSRFVDGTPLNELSGAAREQAEELLRKHFVADALIGNWDVVGLARDNVVVDAGGVPWRVDNGGALAFRAKGALKGGLWNSSLSELDSMRSQGEAGKVFSKVTESDVVKQGQHVLNLAESKNLSHDSVFAGRLKTLAARVEKHGTPAVPATKPGAFMGPSVVARVHAIKTKVNAKLSKSQTGKIALLNDGTHPDHIVLMKSLKDQQVDAFKEAWPGKGVKRVLAAKVLAEKHGLGAGGVVEGAGKKLWHFEPTKMEQLLAGEVAVVKGTKDAKKIANAVKALPTTYKGSGGDYSNIETGNWNAIREKAASVSKMLDKEYPSEYSAIKHWTASSNLIRNHELHGDDTASSLVKHFNAGLDKLPKYEGHVYRGISLSPGSDMYSALTTENNEVHFKNSQSCSRNPKKSRGFGSFMMRIFTRTGAPIEQVSGHNEYEVVTRRDVKYRVAKVEHNLTISGSPVPVMVHLDEVGPAAPDPKPRKKPS